MVEGRPTSRKRKPSAVKEEATRLCAFIVRTTRGPLCEACRQAAAKDHAHIVGRSYAHTRTDETNGLALCGPCHHRFDNFHDDRIAILERTVGVAHYEALKRKALDGVNQKFCWFTELDRLRALARELGVDA